MIEILAKFNDSGWKYNFIILMIGILTLCGIYVTIKIILQNKKIQNPIDTTKENDKITQEILDNEDIIIKKKSSK